MSYYQQQCNQPCRPPPVCPPPKCPEPWAESEIEPAFGSGSRGGIDTRSSLSVSSSFLPWPAVPDSWVPTEDAARCCLGRGCGVGSATAVAVVGGRPSAEVWRTSPGVEPITGFGCLVCDHHRVCGCT